jgi:Fe-S cluster assembly ATP-binding protein
MEPEERSLAGLFMSFQAPIEIPGVSNYDFLLMALNARREKDGLPALGPLEVNIIAAVQVTKSFILNSRENNTGLYVAN